MNLDLFLVIATVASASFYILRQMFGQQPKLGCASKQASAALASSNQSNVVLGKGLARGLVAAQSKNRACMKAAPTN
jgi:hypothetical protein